MHYYYSLLFFAYLLSPLHDLLVWGRVQLHRALRRAIPLHSPIKLHRQHTILLHCRPPCPGIFSILILAYDSLVRLLSICLIHYYPILLHAPGRDNDKTKQEISVKSIAHPISFGTKWWLTWVHLRDVFDLLHHQVHRKLHCYYSNAHRRHRHLHCLCHPNLAMVYYHRPTMATNHSIHYCRYDCFCFIYDRKGQKDTDSEWVVNWETVTQICVTYYCCRCCYCIRREREREKKIWTQVNFFTISTRIAHREIKKKVQKIRFAHSCLWQQTNRQQK